MNRYETNIEPTIKKKCFRFKCSDGVREESHDIRQTDNLNAMCEARQAFIQNQSSDKVKHALTHQIRTSGDDIYTTGDLVFYKKKNGEQWHGPGTAIGQDG